jgi:L-malate glycosyltransferase
LFVIGTGEIGGSELQLLRLARLLRQRGILVQVHFTRLAGPIVDSLAASGVKTTGSALEGSVRNGTGRLAAWRRFVRTVRDLRRVIRRDQPEVVHAILPGATITTMLACWRVDDIRIAGIRGFVPAYSRPMSTLFLRAVRRADAVVCNALHLADEMVGEFGVESSRVRVIPNGVDVPEWRAAVEVSPPRAVMVSNFHGYKGHDTLLDALALVDVPVVVHLCGSGAERESMRSKAEELGVSEKVVFVDPPADVQAELRSAQFAVHPSRTEGMSNAILEQLAAGLPVISCEVGSNALLVEHGVNGLLVPPGDVRALADALTVMATDPVLRERMAVESRDRVERFSWDACVQSHIDLYAELLENTRR